MTLVIRAMLAEDWSAVRSIYAEGIATGNATFEDTPPDWAAFDAGHLDGHRFVAEQTDSIVGWVAASATSSRCSYVGVIEASVYVRGDARGQGVGASLLEALIASAEEAGIWTLQSGIFPENEASVALHLAHGFRIVGRRERMGRMTYGPWKDRWRDVLLLERRSALVG